MGSRLITSAVFGTVLAALLALMPILFPLTGEPGKDIVTALGRFHILVLHFPIALLMMVPVLEILGRMKSLSYLKQTVHVLLILAILFATTACVLGYMLAYGEGDMSVLLDQHMWAGIVTTILMIFTLILREATLRLRTKLLLSAYWLVLLASIGSLISGSHHGASMVHGEDYLFEKFASARSPKITAESAAYETLIKPILQANCYVCHSDVKLKGGYRMDDFALLLEGGDSGMAGVEPGDLEASELHYRITLKPDAKAFMPPAGKTPLNAEQVEWIAWWINTGASETATLEELARDGAPESVLRLISARPAAAREPMDIGQFLMISKQVKDDYGIDVILNSQNPADGVYVAARNAKGPIPAQAFIDLKPIAADVTSINLWRQQLADGAAPELAAFSNMESLNLNETHVKPEDLAALTGLKKLHTLNLHGSAIGDESIETLSRFGSLKHLHLMDSQISEAGAERLRQSLSGCEVLTLIQPLEPQETPNAASQQ